MFGMVYFLIPNLNCSIINCASFHLVRLSSICEKSTYINILSFLLYSFNSGGPATTTAAVRERVRVKFRRPRDNVVGVPCAADPPPTLSEMSSAVDH